MHARSPSGRALPFPISGSNPSLRRTDGAVADPARPFVAIVGGSKVSSKIGVIESLLDKVDSIVLGGGMIFTFYKAQGLGVGASLVEEDKVPLAKSLMDKAKEKGVALLLPTDIVVADAFAPDAKTQIVPADAIPEGWMGLDIGPASISAVDGALKGAKTVIWNGPMGARGPAAWGREGGGVEAAGAWAG